MRNSRLLSLKPFVLLGRDIKAFLLRARQHPTPILVILPSFLLTIIFVYFFILWTLTLSFTTSTLIPQYNWAGWKQYFILWSLPNWYKAISNLGIFGVLYIGFSCGIGLLLAILLDQRIRFEGFIRPILLYPMSLSFIVTGTAWKWLLNPGLGIERVVRNWGWESFTFNWIIDPDRAIYAVILVGVWQSTGFVMTLFLAGLRGIDSDIIKAALLEGASIYKIYLRIILPQLRYTLLSAVIILAHLAIKSYDLVIALTGGGPGNATELPATFMYSYTFTRSKMAIGSASAIMMFMTVVAVIGPYLYNEFRTKKQ
ncbi:sugar ABC transporter permease [Spirochaetota bacterium]|nr:sugar ABC transporter permease [Spirochaetota bacterium]